MANTDPNGIYIVLAADPRSSVRRLRYMTRMDVCSNLPKLSPSRRRANQMDLRSAVTIVRNLRDRGWQAACEPLAGFGDGPAMPHETDCGGTR